jgi:putative phage-type endonuclease
MSIEKRSYVNWDTMVAFERPTKQQRSNTTVVVDLDTNVGGCQRVTKPAMIMWDTMVLTQRPATFRQQKCHRQPQQQEHTSAELVLASLQLTHEQSNSILRMNQGTPEWLAARQNRLTASNFGAAVGVNRYCSPKSLCKQMLWKEFKGNVATQWGTEHENEARQAYIQQMQSVYPNVLIRVEEVGLYIKPEHPWLGSSPDGIVYTEDENGKQERFLLEIKCPFKKQYYAEIPSYYYAQVQGIMALMELPYCDFVVWIPSSGVQIQRIEFNPPFWNDMFLKLKSFYFDFYLPLLVRKLNGELEHGCIV